MKPFASVEDYQSWEKLVEHCDTLDGFTQLEREQAKRSLMFLRGELGDAFLATALESGHPMMQYILNLAPWTRRWLPVFAEELRLAKGDPQYEGVRSRILDSKRFAEAYQVLHTAAAFRRQGFTATSDAGVSTSRGRKVPDLLLRDTVTGDQIYVEVTALIESDVARNAYRTMNRIHAPLWRGVPFLLFAARIHKALAPRHLDDVASRVEQLVQRVQAEGLFASVVIDGVLEIGIAPETDKAMLEQWAAGRGLATGTMEGPPVRVDELHRVRSKIQRKQEQLPPDLPGIVVVFTNHLFPYVKDYRGLIGELEEAVYHHGHLLAAVIGGTYMSGSVPDQLLMHGQHIYLRKTVCDFLVEEYAVLLNHFCEHKVSPSSITKLYNAFKPELPGER